MSEQTDMDVADVLSAAADYLMVHGWQQSMYGGCGEPACGLGALYEAMGRPNDDASVLDSPGHKVLLATVGTEWFPWWNDDRRRTADEVITALLEAAARLRCAP